MLISSLTDYPFWQIQLETTPICGGGGRDAISMLGGIGGGPPVVVVVWVESGAVDLGGAIDGGGGGRDPCMPVTHHTNYDSEWLCLV